MPYLKLTGKKKYVVRMEKHLKKEHPSTRKRMTVCGVKKKLSEKQERKIRLSISKKINAIRKKNKPSSFLEHYRFS